MRRNRPRWANRRSHLIPLLAVPLLASASSCGLLPECPETVEQAASGSYGFVAVGRVARFVASPDSDHRGYDLDIRRTLSGSASGEATFLRVPEEVPGVERGKAVLIVAEPGPNPRTIIAGECQPLRTIGDDELLRWAGDR